VPPAEPGADQYATSPHGVASGALMEHGIADRGHPVVASTLAGAALLTALVMDRRRRSVRALVGNERFEPEPGHLRTVLRRRCSDASRRLQFDVVTP
jgi:hypothetical protein